MGAGDIPFRKEMSFEYGVADQVTPLVRRVVAENPGPFTLHGTNSYIVGHGRVTIIDPGPLLDDHIASLVRAVEGEVVEHIIVTHTHHDHSPAARPLQKAVGGVISGAQPKPVPEGVKTTESIHREFDPDRELADGDSFNGDGWTLETVHTPGHMSNHMCLALAEEGILFTGDHIMGWNTTVVSPPDGNMGDYLASLERCLGRDDRTYWPAHGPEIAEPKPFVRAYRTHRRMREGEILRCIEGGAYTIPAM
ncbi:MAG: MBL fold metallo-hydrolase, partial [Alphaproteobacteria bacterium]